MKFLRSFVLFVAALLAVQPTFAQYQVQNHGVPIGRGGGVTGFGVAAPGAAGGVLTSNGPGADPSMQPLPSLSAPGGRLTLISGQPEMTTNIGSQNLYYTPDVGNGIQIYNGTSVMNFVFSEQTLSLGGSAAWPAGTIFDAFEIINGGIATLVSRQWDSTMLPSAPVAIPPANLITSQTGASTWLRPSAAFNGTPNQAQAASAVINPSNNSLNNCIGQDWGVGQANAITQVVITAPNDQNLIGNSAPTVTKEVIKIFGSSDNVNWQPLVQPYYDVSGAFGRVFTIPINPVFTTPYRHNLVCLTGNGTQSVNVAQIVFYKAGTPPVRRLSILTGGGFLVNDAPMTARVNASTTVSVPAGQGRYVGSFMTDPSAPGVVTCHFDPGPSRVCNIWNMYNQRNKVLQAGTVATLSNINNGYSYPLTNPANISWGPAELGNTGYSMSVLIGYPLEQLTVSWPRAFYLNSAPANASAPYEAGIGVNTFAAFCGTELSSTTDGGVAVIGVQATAYCTLPPFFGSNTFYGLERAGPFVNGGTVFVFQGVQNSGLQATYRY